MKKAIIIIILLIICLLGFMIQSHLNHKEHVLNDEEYIAQLNIAISEENITQVKTLLKESRNLNQYPKFYDDDDSGRAHTPLENACDIGNYEIVKLLIDNGADVNYYDNGLGYSPLMFAVESDKENSNTKIVKLLIKNGANKNIKDKNNKTALDFAIESNNKDLIKILQ